MSSTHRPSRPARRNTASNRHDARVGTPEAFRLRPTVLAVALHGVLIGGIGAGAAVLPQQAHAQPSGANSAAATALPQGDAVKSFSIPAGPLDAALNSFARVAGVNLSYDAALVAGLNSQGLNGNHGTAAGLVRLLEGSGLEALAQPGGGYSLRKFARAVVPAAGAGQQVPTLAEVKVVAQGERAGRTEGTGSFTTGSSSAATGMNLKLRETPQSVTVITRERMDQQHMTSSLDVLNQTPGIHIEAGGNGQPTGNRNSIYSRGYEIRNYQVDGVPGTMNVGTHTYNVALDTAVYDSVAVVRGATGLLMGAGDPGGSVTLTRKRPTRDMQASLEAGYGNWGRHRVVADAGGPLNAAGTVRGRVVAAHQDNSYWVSKYKADQSVVYGVLDADIGDRTVLSVALQTEKYKANATEIQPPPIFYQGTDVRTPFGRNDLHLPGHAKNDDRKSSLMMGLEHRFNDDWDAKLNVNHGKSKEDVFRTYHGAMVVDAAGRNAYAYVEEMPHKAEDEVNALNFRLNGKYGLLGRQHELVAGFNMAKSETHTLASGYDMIFDLDNPPAWVDAAGRLHTPRLVGELEKDGSKRKSKQSGTFLATKFNMSDRLSLIAGGRWSKWDTRYINGRGQVSDERSYSGVFTPYAGATFELSDAVSAYASYTEIFNPQGVKDASGNLLDPEQGKNYELGLKGEWLDGRLNASLAAFQSGKDNLAVAVLNSDGTCVRIRDGSCAYRAEDDTKAKGWELEVSGQLLPGWQLQAGYSSSTLKDSKGKVIRWTAPKQLFKLFTSYQFQAHPQLTIGGGVNWRSRIEDPSDAEYYIGSYAVIDLMARYDFSKNLNLTVNLNNALNKDYRLSTGSHSYGAKRNIYATLKYHF